MFARERTELRFISRLQTVKRNHQMRMSAPLSYISVSWTLRFTINRTFRGPPYSCTRVHRDPFISRHASPEPCLDKYVGTFLSVYTLVSGHNIDEEMLGRR